MSYNAKEASRAHTRLNMVLGLGLGLGTVEGVKNRSVTAELERVAKAAVNAIKAQPGLTFEGLRAAIIKAGHKCDKHFLAEALEFRQQWFDSIKGQNGEARYLLTILGHTGKIKTKITHPKKVLPLQYVKYDGAELRYNPRRAETYYP